MQIQQVLLNLIRNTIEAMEESERRELVLSSARSVDDAVIMTVSDTGPGIRKELRNQLFQPFFTTNQHGMGVGLSISRNIIEAHGGELGAEPNPGGGTVFRIRLPAVTDEEAHHVG